PVGVTAQAVVGETAQRVGGAVPKAEIIQPTHARIGAGHDHRALAGEHPPELIEAGPIWRTLDDQAIAFRSHRPVWCHGALAADNAFLDLCGKLFVVKNCLLGAAKGGEDRSDVVDAAKVAVDRGRTMAGGFPDSD